MRVLLYGLWLIFFAAVAFTIVDGATQPRVLVDADYQRIVIPEAMEDWYVCLETTSPRGVRTQVCMEAYRITDPYPEEAPAR